MRNMFVQGALCCALIASQAGSTLAANASTEQGAFDGIDSILRAGTTADVNSTDELKQQSDALANRTQELRGQNLGTEKLNAKAAQLASLARQLQDHVATALALNNATQIAFLRDELHSLQGQVDRLVESRRLACGSQEATGGAQGNNAVPAIIPSLRSWRGGTGAATLASGNRIVVEPLAFELKPVAELLAKDIAELSGLTLPIVVDTQVRAGDIAISLSPCPAAADRLGDEGYTYYPSSKGIVLRARTKVGIVRSTRTLLQAMALNGEGYRSVQNGYTIDYPDYKERGFMLDVGRKFFTKEFLIDYIKLLSYFKMNTFQLHLNDNKINPRSINDYSAFRLKTDNPELAGLAANDGSFTKADWDELEDIAALYGVTILPEIDAPAHSLNFVKFKPGISLNNRLDELDLKNPESTRLLKSVFSEFTPWFRSKVVHIGADEYHGDKDDYVNYIKTMNDHLNSLGKISRIWGSFTQKGIDTSSINKNIEVDAWNNGWYSVGKSISDGFRTTNVNDGLLYVVPRADYYHPNGLNVGDLFMNWTPEKAGGANDGTTPQNPKLLGAKMAVWNDKAADGVVYSELDVHKIIQRSLSVVAQKTWNASPTPPETSFGLFLRSQAVVGVGPGLSLVKNTLERPVAKPGDIAFEKSASASSSYPGMTPELVNDGDAISRWAALSSAGSEWVQIDLGKQHSLNKVILNWEFAHAKDYDVKVSVDGANWTTVAQRRGISTATVETISFPPTLGRFVRMQGITRGTVYPYSIFDFEVYSDASTVN